MNRVQLINFLFGMLSDIPEHREIQLQDRLNAAVIWQSLLLPIDNSSQISEPRKRQRKEPKKRPRNETNDDLEEIQSKRRKRLHTEVLKNREARERTVFNDDPECLICKEEFTKDEDIVKKFNDENERKQWSLRWIRYRSAEGFHIEEEDINRASKEVDLKEFMRRYKLMERYIGKCKHQICRKCRNTMLQRAREEKKTSGGEYKHVECPLRCPKF